MVCARRNAYYSSILNGKLENATVIQLVNPEGDLLEPCIICSGMSCKCRLYSYTNGSVYQIELSSWCANAKVPFVPSVSSGAVGKTEDLRPISQRRYFSWLREMAQC